MEEYRVIIGILCIAILVIIVIPIIVIIDENKPRFEEIEEDVETKYKMGNKHYTEAIDWYKKAAKGGHKQAQEKLKQLGEEW